MYSLLQVSRSVVKITDFRFDESLSSIFSLYPEENVLYYNPIFDYIIIIHEEILNYLINDYYNPD
jgi:hypothetical protein